MNLVAGGADPMMRGIRDAPGVLWPDSCAIRVHVLFRPAWCYPRKAFHQRVELLHEEGRSRILAAKTAQCATEETRARKAVVSRSCGEIRWLPERYQATGCREPGSCQGIRSNDALSRDSGRNERCRGVAGVSVPGTGGGRSVSKEGLPKKSRKTGKHTENPLLNPDSLMAGDPDNSPKFFPPRQITLH
ncbi:hypothetical protein BKA81DRAFT_137188 [Phyllosticta paracitricarpa]